MWSCDISSSTWRDTIRHVEVTIVIMCMYYIRLFLYDIISVPSQLGQGYSMKRIGLHKL